MVVLLASRKNSYILKRGIVLLNTSGLDLMNSSISLNLMILIFYSTNFLLSSFLLYGVNSFNEVSKLFNDYSSWISGNPIKPYGLGDSG